MSPEAHQQDGCRLEAGRVLGVSRLGQSVFALGVSLPSLNADRAAPQV